MKVENRHKRIINRPLEEVSELMLKLTSKEDPIWPKNQWPAMRFKDGLNIGAIGGHGIIRYVIEAYQPGAFIKFKFLEPKGFNGYHQLEINALGENQTEVMHSIYMSTSGLATLKWSNCYSLAS